MTNTITHFMWGFQRHYTVTQECRAERVFKKLDSRFKPEVFLVGILSESRSDRFPACVDPEDDFWIASEEFNDVLVTATGKAAADPEQQIMHSHLIAQESHEHNIQGKALKDVIKNIIDKSKNKPSDYSYYVSMPILVDCYMVCVVLGLQDSVSSEYYSLIIGEVPLHQYRNIPVPRSLIEAAAESFLLQATQEPQKPDAGRSLYSPSVDEVLRIAATEIMRGIVWKVDNGCISGMSGMFQYCNMIASLHYERAAGSGVFALARKDHPALNTKVSFLTPTKTSSQRAARKLLELASKDMALHTNSEQIYGLVEIQEYDLDKEDLFTIRIVDHHHWELCHGSGILMVVKYGMPSLPKTPFDHLKLRHDLERLFKGMKEEDIQCIVQLVQQAEKEQHGTMLLITEKAESEAGRLATQGTPIAPCGLTPDLLKHLTPIDGALVLSPQGICYAIGIILDGMATESGNPSRGARYNSAIRYVQSSESNCLAVVCSEDGGIDFIPELRPAIRKSKISAILNELEMISDAATISWRRYRENLDWLDEHRFYLLKEHCETANALVEKIETRIDNEEERSVKIVRSPFSPNPGMDEVMFYLDE